MRTRALAAAIMLALVFALPAVAADKTGPARPYVVMSGGLGDIVGFGVRPLAEKVRRQCGAEVIVNGGASRIPSGRPLVFVGHSKGAAEAINHARAIAPRSVALVVTLDPCSKFCGELSRPSNVKRLVNYRQTHEFLGGALPRGASLSHTIQASHIGFARDPRVMRLAAAEICRAR